MKVEEAQWLDETYGVKITSESEEEEAMLQRFWEGGVKVNSITPRSKHNTTLIFTFADLLKLKAKTPPPSSLSLKGG